MNQNKDKISSLRNLGAQAQKDFEAIGITTAQALLKLDPKDAFLKMLQGRKKRSKSVKCCNALYLYAIYGAIHNIDWRNIPEKKKREFKAYTETLRKSGLY